MTFDVRPETVQEPPLFTDDDLTAMLNGRPDLARPHDPATSHLAARSVVDSAEVRLAIRNVLIDGPIIDEDLHALLVVGGHRWTAERTRTVRSQMVRTGEVVDSGHKGTTSRGRKAVLWMLNRSAA